jgi:phage tail-like protein
MYPIRNFKYAMEIDGIQLGFSEVSGYDSKVKEITYREGNEALNNVIKLPGLMEYGQITLKRGVDESQVLFNWINETGSGKITKKTVTLTAMGDDGQPAAVWKVINAWPVSYTVSDFKGDGNEVVLETLVLTHEGMTRDK